MKAELILDREDGTRVRIVAEDFTKPWDNEKQLGVYANITDQNGKTRVVDTNNARSIPNGMSVEEYKTSEERGLFKYISYSEYLQVCQILTQSIAIQPCGCGEDEFLSVYPKFNKYQVFCVNCGNTGQALSTVDKCIEFWNELSRFDGVVAPVPG